LFLPLPLQVFRRHPDPRAQRRGRPPASAVVVALALALALALAFASAFALAFLAVIPQRSEGTRFSDTTNITSTKAPHTEGTSTEGTS
jgi:hypothetical protein